jgi:fructoselysine-6-P-deglycase FrlB-like protein
MKDQVLLAISQSGKSDDIVELTASAKSSVDVLAGAASLVTIGRGPTLAIAREAAPKLKERCNLPAEAFSGAESLHGSVAHATLSYPIIMFMPTDVAAEGMHQLPPICAARVQRSWPQSREKAETGD